MNRLQTVSLIAARVLLALVFLLNGLGIVDQSEALRELIGRGAPVSIAPTLLWIARAVEVVAGTSLAFGIFPELAALGLISFLIPATWVGHPFWLEAGTATYIPQLINFFKNVAIIAGLLFVASNGDQAALLSTSILYRRKLWRLS